MSLFHAFQVKVDFAEFLYKEDSVHNSKQALYCQTPGNSRKLLLISQKPLENLNTQMRESSNTTYYIYFLVQGKNVASNQTDRI